MWLILLIILLFFILIFLLNIKKKLQPIINNKVVNDYVIEEKITIENDNYEEQVEQYNNIIDDTTNIVKNTPIENFIQDDINNITFLIDRNPYRTINQFNDYENNDDLMIFDLMFQDLDYPNFYLNIPTIIQEDLNILTGTTVNWRKIEADKEGKNKKEKIDKYIEKSKVIRSDIQNVHDTMVNEDLRKTYIKLDNDDKNITNQESIDSIKQFIDNSDLSENIKFNANKTYKYIMSSDYKVFQLGHNVHLKNILRLTWNRGNHPKNIKQKENIKESVIIALSDCIENNKVVCSGGIGSRLLSSMVLIDYDSTIGTTQTTSEYKSEIFSKSQDIFQEQIKISLESKDPEIKKFAESFTDTNIDDSTISKNIKDNFYKSVENKVDGMLKTYDKSHIPLNVKDEIMAGLII